MVGEERCVACGRHGVLTVGRVLPNGWSATYLINAQPLDNHNEDADAEVEITGRFSCVSAAGSGMPRLRKVSTRERSRSVMKSAMRLVEGYGQQSQTKSRNFDGHWPMLAAFPAFSQYIENLSPPE